MLFFSLSFLFFYSCQKDELIEAPPDGVSSGLVYQKITRSDVENNTALLKAIKSYNRTIQETPLQKSTKSSRLKDYKIDYHKGVLITNNQTRSYTFKLVPRNANSTPAPYLLNIVFVTPKAKANFWHRVIAYDLTPQQHFKLKNGKRLTGKLAYTYINTQNPETPILFNHPHTLTPNRPPRAASGGDEDGDGNGMGGELPTVTITAPPPDDNWPPEDDTTPPVEEVDPSFTEDDDNGGGGGGSTTPVEDDNKEKDEPDPCEEIAKFFDSKLKQKLMEILQQTDDTMEHGYSINTSNQYTKLKPDGPHSLDIDVTDYTTAYIHIHTNEDGIVHMFSPGDISTFMKIVYKARQNNRSLDDVYGLMASDHGIFIIKFSGDYSDVTGHQYNIDSLNNIYKNYFREIYSKAERARTLLNFAKEEMGLSNLEVYRVKTDSQGNIEQTKGYYLNDNNHTKSTDWCNQ